MNNSENLNSQKKASLIPLSRAKKGQRAIVESYQQIAPQDQEKFLGQGLLEGDEIEIMGQSSMGSPLSLCYQGRYLLAVDKTLAQKVLIRLL